MASINVSKSMKAEAYLGNQRFNVSQSAIDEYTDRIKTAFEYNMQALCKIASKDNRKTILERDVLELFGHQAVKTEHVEGGQNIYEYL